MEELIHTLKDLRTILECVKHRQAQDAELIKRLEVRIVGFEERVDRMASRKRLSSDHGAWP